MLEKKALSFPLWAEGLLVIVLGVMSVIEFRHAEWFWGIVFGASALVFGVTAAARFKTGGKDGQE